uniref:Rho guanine nucleotide exchange factor 12-like n=1 Tax=Scophthalmus maximus TaxID=52904 RepID=A0A8D3EBR9_SCOMX
MSVPHSTLTDRTPNILNKDPADKRPKNDKSPVSLKQEFDPTGLVQRCVIIQRDENGFGLTVSGDNPVFVQLVKEDGAAMRAGVQTGDRIIKVRSPGENIDSYLLIHFEKVKTRDKSGSYVALTVLGRPPGLQIPLEEEEGEREREEEGAEVGSPSSSSPAALPGPEPSSPWTSGTPPLPDGVRSPAAFETFTRRQILLLKSTSSFSNSQKNPQRLLRRLSTNSSNTYCTGVSHPCAGATVFHLHDIRPDTFSNDKEKSHFELSLRQINGECSCFQSFDLLKSRPAHLAVFLHHVVSQFDPTPLLCFLYADMHKQTSSKESRRFFVEFHSLFMDRTANLKVPVPETIAAELEKRRLELIPEELCKQLTQTLQDSLLPDLHRNLDDFRQKRSMGLTLAEDELCKLDVERGKDQPALEKECSCAEHIISKIEDILLTSLPSEEEKCQTMQYVILTYMKHLGVKVKEPRGLEHKRPRINFLPKIKVRTSGVDKKNTVGYLSLGKAVELNKQRSPKQLPQPAPGIPEHSDPPASNPPSGRIRGSQLSEGSDGGGGGGGAHVLPSPTHGSPAGQASDASGQDSDSSKTIPVFLLCEGLGASPLPLSGPGSRMEAQCAASSADVQSEDDQAGEAEREEDPPNWQSLVSRDVLASLTPQEIKRQEVINELFYTERAHLRMLKVLDCVFHQRLSRDGILPSEEIRHIFINLEEILQLHVSVTEQMTATRKRSETSVIGPIGDDLLAWFGGEEEEKIKRAVGTFCSNQPSALEFIKTKKKKDQRFYLFMREAESNRLCRRLQLKDIIPVEMQRLTKYPLLLDNIAKYTEDGDEREKVKKAGECCKKILNHVNQAVKEAENKQRLEDYQRRLDLSSLKQSENPMILELRNLDLTKRKMVHEGPLSWRVNKDKRIELYTILLEDILVLLQKQDERLVLKFHGKNPASAADTTNIFSPVIKLSTVLVRPVATHNKSFFVLSMSDNGAQIYELRAQTESDQRMWQCLITQCAEAMKAKPHNSDTPPAQSEPKRSRRRRRRTSSAGPLGASRVTLCLGALRSLHLLHLHLHLLLHVTKAEQRQACLRPLNAMVL